MRVNVELTVDIDVDATEEQVEEYLMFELEYSGRCRVVTIRVLKLDTK